MSKADLKAIRNWLKNVRKFSTGSRYGYHPFLDLSTMCIRKYLHEINGGVIQDISSVNINGTEVEIGDFLRELRRDNSKSKQRLDVIGHGHENLNLYLKEETTPCASTLKNLIAIMTAEIKADIDMVKTEIEVTLKKSE
jgi:hypothetical protein